MKHTVATNTPPPVKPPYRQITIAITFETLAEAESFLDVMGRTKACEGISYPAYCDFKRAVEDQR